MKKTYPTSFFLSFILFLFISVAHAQGPGSLFVDAGPDQTLIPGSGGCTTITATFLETFDTSATTYEVNSIPYTPPFAFDGLANSIDISTDDVWSPVDTLPFDFCFFGNLEQDFQVGSNGVIRFDVDAGDTSNGWAFSEDLPNNTNATLGEANVFTPVHDIHPSINPGNEIGYEVLGAFPNRVLVVSYFEVAMFSGACNSLEATHMAVFYEYSNVIEIYIKDKPTCPTWNSGNAAVGIQNNAGDTAYVPPGRNTSDSPWTTNDEAWSFSPVGPETYVFEWLDDTGTVVSTDPEFDVCVLCGTTTYTARVTYNNTCNGDIVILEDTIDITFGTFMPDLGPDVDTCDTDPIVLDANTGLTGLSYEWFYNAVSQGPSTIDDTMFTVLAPNSGTYTVEVFDPADPTCIISDDVIINFFPQPIIENPADDLFQCDDGVGTGIFDLTVNSPVILGTQIPADFTITYHTSQVDADTGANPIVPDNAYLITTPPLETLYVRIQDLSGTCFATDEFTIEFAPVTAGPMTDILNLCDQDSDGMITLNLITLKNTEALNGQNPADYSVSYHPTQLDADNNTNAHPNPYDVTTSPETIFVRVENNNSPLGSCFATDSFIVEFFIAPALNNPTPYDICDELPNDGFAEFNLPTKDNEITGGNPDAVVTYYETLNDAQNATNVIAAPATYINIVQGFQTVYARAENINSADCFNVVALDLRVNDSPLITDPITDYIICDNDEDGLEEFDLTSKDAEISNILVNLVITYHTSEADATAGANVIPNPTMYVSGGEVVWARAENVAGCFSVVSFSLVLDTIPLFVDVPEFFQCDNDGDGMEFFDLNTQNAIIVDGDLDLSVTYHPTELDADDATNALTPIPYPSFGEVIWVRVESNSRGCYSVFDMELIVVERPEIFEPDPLTICDDNNDGFGLFTLTDADDQVVNGNPAGNLVVSYHETMVNAQNNVDPLLSPYLNIVPFNQTVYVRLSDIASGCYNVTTLELIVLDTPQISDPSALEECDTDGDGVFIFNLTDAEPEILAGLTGGPYVVNYFEDPALTIPIFNTTAYPNISNPQTLFVTVSDTGNSCLAETTLELIVNLPPLLNEPMPYTLCDENDPPGAGMEVFDLTSRTAEITGGSIGIIVSYYETLADAQAGTNAIVAPEAYTNINNPQDIYIRGENSTTGCEQTGGINGLVLELRVENIPDVEDPTPLVVCDMDNDGVALFDLTSKDAEIAGGDPSITITYHETLLDAQDGTFALASPYQNIVADMQTVYARAEFSIAPNDTGCFDIVELDLIVLPSPSLPLEIDPIIACEPGNTAVFDLTERELQILNGQDPLSFTVSYYETLGDAQGATNAIAVPTAYTNTSNPQTIFVRVSDNTNLCAVTSSFEIEVREPPVANQPIPFTKCDDLGEPNDGIASFDLTTKDVEIAGVGLGINVSYYLTAEDAQDATNAIDPATAYVNQDPDTGVAINPQTIFVRVDDVTTDCEGFTSMTLRVVSNPEPVTPEAIELCDINDPNDGVEVFDLTIREAQILNGENWSLEYYETFTDAVDQTNAIATPGAYPNISNPQIVYVRVTNGSIPEMCFEIVELELIVNPLPDASAEVTPLVACQAPNTGFALFDLTEKQGEILGGQDPALFTVTYYETAGDAAIMFDPIVTPSSYANLSNPQTIYVGIQNIETTCYIALQEFELRIDDGAIANTPLEPYAICDNTDPNDGIADFTLDDPTDPLSQAQLLRDEILGGQDPLVFLLTYHETFANAEDNIDPLGAIYTNIVNPQVIYARVSNSVNDCFAITEVILKVEQLPILALDEQYRLCVDADGLPIESEFGGPSPPVLDTGLSSDDYIFLWELDGVVLVGEVGSSIIATQPGVYTVTVTERITGCMERYTTTVILSSPPTVFDVDVTTGAFAGEHAINATAEGLGLYQFQLDDGPFQDDGMFNNVAPGSHTVTIQDVNGCGSVTLAVGVVDYPRFMTPNLDGYNDTWNIIGIADADPTAKIYIFDRHGKLLKQISPTGEGWDGTYNGNPLPSSDYWFVVEYIEDETPKEFKGHFTLKR